MLPPIINNIQTPQIDGSGDFVPDSVAYFVVSFNDITGQLYDPSTYDINVYDPNNDLVTNLSSMDKLAVGNYLIQWNIPKTAITGKYKLSIDYTYETATDTKSATFEKVFVVNESSVSYLDLRVLESRTYLEYLLGYVQKIPVFDEPARLNKDKNIATLSFPRWNQTSGVKVIINNSIRETGYTVDYNNGKIIFDNALSNYDNVLVSYNFRWLKDEELDSFVNNGINIFNSFAPHTSYSVLNLPTRYYSTPFYAAAIDAIRRWMMDILFQEPAKIFGGPERANQVFGSLDALKKNYEEMLYKLLDEKKKGPYAGLTRTISSEVYSLPGSRSRWFANIFKGST